MTLILRSFGLKDGAENLLLTPELRINASAARDLSSKRSSGGAPTTFNFLRSSGPFSGRSVFEA